MKLIDNWKHVLKNAWSVRILAVAVLFTAADVALSTLGYLPWMPQWAYSAIYGTISALAFASRLIAQQVFQQQAGGSDAD